MNLNEAQRRAVSHVNGPMLTLAGPGSGKTTVITERVRYLIEQAGVDPIHILVITFTRAAAQEMRSRFYAGMDHKSTACTFGTFHSVFFMILKAAYHYTGENILSESEKYRMLKEIVSRMDLDYEDKEDFLQGIITEISQVKSETITLSNYYSKSCGEEEFRTIYRTYEKELSKMHKLDFDDMLVYCYELFRERPDILKNWQKRYQYILIDEFQDINPIQYRIIKMMAQPKQNIFIVGDDDQSIYRFRGARPELMREFLKDFPGAEQVLLNVNYRCSWDICASAAREISHNGNRFVKKIQAKAGYKEAVKVCRVRTRQEENLHVVKMLMTYKNQGISYESMAVLYRTNIQPRALVSTLMSYNIPFQMRDTIPSLYQHFTVQHMLTYIRIAMGDDSRAAYLSIINRPKRYISRDAFTDEQVDIEKLIRFYEGKQWAVDYLLQLSNDLHVLAKMSPFGAVNFIRRAIGYDSYLAEYAKDRRISVDEMYQVLDEFAEQVKPYKTYEEMFAGIEAYEEDMARQHQMTKTAAQGVTLATMHSAKGLEFDAVFILEANEGLIPHKRSVQPEEIEEERRMFYVAMTRAKRYLHIYNVQELYGKTTEPSRFLEELLSDKV